MRTDSHIFLRFERLSSPRGAWPSIPPILSTFFLPNFFFPNLTRRDLIVTGASRRVTSGSLSLSPEQRAEKRRFPRLPPV